ncbi:MAG: LysR family transcriptional regulator [Sphingomonas sp. SCN 67-18]|uniref:LysR family transcriptional regulator n=1 Tax=uncultured Sphingomonas sp. TaxID=158754 RepID=UPI000868F1EC|nr:LysR family transcriptional regulator [Sphingomonas sp. SCN 67-18]ODU20432.1 MAG: LysR family transcriptional regulator [Sphingomonas sp. SCN 67-18]
MQLRLVRYFVALARLQHFARAAQACGVTQPTLSAGLITLEEQVGARLIIRDRRYIGLTPEGEAMLPWAQQMVAASESMMQAAEVVRGPLSGELRIGSIPAAMTATGQFTRAVLAEHETLTVSVRSSTSREIEFGLGNFELDAGLTYLDHEPPSSVLKVPLYFESYMFVTHAEGPHRERRSIGWAEAVSTPLCLLHQGMQNRRILDSRLAARGLVLRPRTVADSYVGLLAMVRAGGLSTIIPDSYAPLVPEHSWARILPFDDPVESSRIGLIVLDRSPLSALAAAALATARTLTLT